MEYLTLPINVSLSSKCVFITHVSLFSYIFTCQSFTFSSIFFLCSSSCSIFSSLAHLFLSLLSDLSPKPTMQTHDVICQRNLHKRMFRCTTGCRYNINKAPQIIWIDSKEKHYIIPVVKIDLELLLGFLKVEHFATCVQAVNR